MRRTLSLGVGRGTFFFASRTNRKNETGTAAKWHAVSVDAENFPINHLGGRFQESMSPEVAKRLKEITVDPKTVMLAAPPK